MALAVRAGRSASGAHPPCASALAPINSLTAGRKRSFGEALAVELYATSVPAADVFAR